MNRRWRLWSCGGVDHPRALVATEPGPMRNLALVIAGATGRVRMYVGARLPLDIAGGFLAGSSLGGTSNAVRRAALG